MQNINDERMIADSNEIFQLAILSVIGDREEQQDSFGYALKEDEGIVVVCDGMGGHRGGAVASRIATDAFISDYNSKYPYASIADELQKSSYNANKRICGLTDDAGKPLKAGSTVVSIIVRGKQLYWNSVGDSRAYLFRNGEIVQFTQDQNYKTVLKEQLNAGIISRDVYDSEKNRGEALVSYLGVNSELQLIDYNDSPLELKTGDRIILMSDGLYKIVSDEEICRIIDNFNNVNDAIRALEMKAKKKKAINRDNMTVAIIKIK